MSGKCPIETQAPTATKRGGEPILIMPDEPATYEVVIGIVERLAAK